MLLERVASVGVEHVIVFDLTLPNFRDALSVVRVVAPGLDGPGVVHNRPSERTARLAQLRATAAP